MQVDECMLPAPSNQHDRFIRAGFTFSPDGMVSLPVNWYCIFSTDGHIQIFDGANVLQARAVQTKKTSRLYFI